jgi:osmoprotectant transport system permease protein
VEVRGSNPLSPTSHPFARRTGGYGQPILTGIRLADNRLILLGAIPAAILALTVQAAFGLLEKYVVPRGLRIKPRG